MWTDAQLAPAFRTALERLSTPMLLLTGAGHVVHANRAAAALLRGPGFRLAEGRLILRRKADRAALAACLLRVVSGGGSESLRLTARSGEATELLTLDGVPGQALATLCIATLRAKLPLAPGWSIAAFQFTPQGAELAEHLAEGWSLAETADRTGVTLGALRTRLKKLLAQTGTRSQAALVAVLLRAAATGRIGN